MGFLFFIAVIGIIIYLSSNANKANRQKWQLAANQLKLVLDAGGGGRIGTISGEINGHKVTVSTFTRGSGSSSQTYTKYLLEYRDRIPVDFKMVTQGLRHSVGKAFGLQDIEVGNKEFDDQILLQGAQPNAVAAWLTPNLQDEIRYMAATYPDIVITNDIVAVNRRGTDTDPDIIAHTVRRMVEFSDGITSPSSTDAESRYIHDDSDELIIEPVEPSYNPLSSSNPIVPEPVWTEIKEEELVTEEEPSLEMEIPVVEETPPAIELTPEAEHDEPVAADVTDLETIATELSGGDTGQSLIAGKSFEQKYKGQQVKGTGVLRRVTKFSYDPVFKYSRGVKAVFEICELAGPYSKVKIMAVVKHPEEDFDRLEQQIDASLPITGTLVAFDSMMQHYFIEP